jgi:hypothetical protein
MEKQSATGPQHYQLYRKSTIGSALTDSLEELITGGNLNPELAMAVLAQVRPSAARTENLPCGESDGAMG